MIALLVALAAQAAPPCLQPTTTVDLVGALTQADSAFVSMDLGAFQQAHDAARVALGCLGEPIDPVDAAWVHRMEALQAFVKEDPVLARRAFQSSLAILPSYQLPSRIAPEGNPLRVLYDEAGLLPASTTEAMHAPEGTSLYVDGARTNDRPVDRPYVLQGLDRRGAVEGTEWLLGGDPLPSWAKGPPPALTEAKRPRGNHRLSNQLLVAGGAAVVVAGASYGLAWAWHGQYQKSSTPLDKLDGLRARTNGAAVTSVVLGGAGLGLAGAGLVVRW